MVKIWNPSPTDKVSEVQFLESGIWNPLHGIQNPGLSWIPLRGTLGEKTLFKLTLGNQNLMYWKFYRW